MKNQNNKGYSLEYWINSFQNKNKTNRRTLGYFIYGPGGSGKTTTIKQSLIKLNWDIFEIDPFNVSCDLLNNVTQNTFVNQTNKTCILIEDINSVIKTTKLLSLLVEVLTLKSTKYTRRPIIITSDEKPWGKLDKIRKLCILDEFKTPSYNEMISSLKNEGFNNDKMELDSIIKNSGGNYNFSINQLKFASLIPKGEEYQIDNAYEDLKTVKMTSQSKNKRKNVFDFYRDIVWKSDKMSYEDCLDAHFYDTHQIPLFIQENYLSNLDKNNPIENSSVISDYISQGDVIDGYIKKNHIYDVTEIYKANLMTVLPLKNMNTTRNFYFPKNLQGYFPFFPSSIGKQSTSRSNKNKLNSIRVNALRNKGDNESRFIRMESNEEINLFVKNILDISSDIDYEEGLFRMFPDYDTFKHFVKFGLNSNKNKILWKNVSRSDKIRIGKYWKGFKKSTNRRRKRKKKKKKKKKEKVTKTKRKSKNKKNKSLSNLFAIIKGKNVNKKRKRKRESTQEKTNGIKRRRRRTVVKDRKPVIFNKK